MKITIEGGPGLGWTVSMDDRSCFQLCWDEMLGQVAKLTLELPPCYSMKTQEEHEEYERMVKKLAERRGEL